MVNFFEGEKVKEFEEFVGGRAPKVIYKRPNQVGKSNKSRDIKRKALAPGKRLSKAGKIYYEYRKNRTDVNGTKI